MAYWLLKSEPTEWSWAEQVKAGTSDWTGVTNAQALNNMKSMRFGDLAFFYHTGAEKQIVGIVEVIKAFQPTPEGGFVTVAAKKPANRPLSLAGIKSDAALAHLALVKQPRLSVQPVDDRAWRHMLALIAA
jgi:predicted RNA-binding protein with PUA-like domain